MNASSLITATHGQTSTNSAAPHSNERGVSGRRPVDRQRVLFIAPLPPPMHGQALASQVILDELKKCHDVDVVDMAKERPKGFVDRLQRCFATVGFLWQVFRFRKKADVIYLTVSESVLGNIKDLAIYLICLRQLNKTYIHLHGGAGMAHIMKGRNFLWAALNRFFIKRMKGVIVLGETHEVLFTECISREKIHLVPNFAEDYLFIERQAISKKGPHDGKINLLFLSNLIKGKGHEELIEAYLALDEERRSRVVLNIAGGFKSEASKSQFFARTDSHPGIVYHGIVKGEEKKRLFNESHVFCLPTYYPYEGQPISILEAYASGCAVLTTDHSGIRDVFADRVNGFEVSKKSPASIKAALEHIVDHPDELPTYALRNHDLAVEKYRTTIYNKTLTAIMSLDGGEELDSNQEPDRQAA